MSLLHPALALIIVIVAAWVLNAFIPMPDRMKPMVNVVLALIVVGVALDLINTWIPMAGSIKSILNIVVVVATCVGVLKAVGLWDRIVRMWSNFTTRHQIPQ